ncbi:FG-GAP repeat domain-containing protein, partial [Micromonospora mangrovi]
MRTSTISPVLRRAARAALAVAVAGLGAVAVAAPTPAQASTAGGPISRGEILDRAQYWVDQGITYDTNALTAGPDGGSYRRDCSGLVSMAWHLTSNYNTTAFQQLDGSHPWHALGSLGDLQPGDAIVRTGHMELFARWKSVADHSQGAYVYSFNQTGETVRNPDAVSNFGNIGFDSYSDLTTYTPIRYDHVVGTASYSGDGLADLQTVNTSTGVINHFRNISPGNWAPVAAVGSGWAGADPNRLHWADMNGDGRSDLVVAGSDGVIKLYPNLGQGTWGT